MQFYFFHQNDIVRDSDSFSPQSTNTDCQNNWVFTGNPEESTLTCQFRFFSCHFSNSIFIHSCRLLYSFHDAVKLIVVQLISTFVRRQTINKITSKYCLVNEKILVKLIRWLNSGRCCAEIWGSLRNIANWRHPLDDDWWSGLRGKVWHHQETHLNKSNYRFNIQGAVCFRVAGNLKLTQSTFC